MSQSPDHAYCRTQVAAEGANLYYALLFTEEATQRTLLPLLCFEAEITRIVQTCQDSGVARLKLLWWREELDRLYRGEASHPISRALAASVGIHSVHRARLLAHIATTESLLCVIEQPESLHACIRLFTPGAGAIWQLGAELTGCTDTDTLAMLAQTAAVNTLLSLLGQTVFHLHQNRIFIPGEYLSPASVPACLNQDSATVCAVFLPLLSALRRYLQRLCDDLPAAERPRQLHALILCRLLAHQCRIHSRHCDSFLRERYLMRPLTKLFIAWKTKQFRR